MFFNDSFHLFIFFSQPLGTCFGVYDFSQGICFLLKIYTLLGVDEEIKYVTLQIQRMIVQVWQKRFVA